MTQAVISNLLDYPQGYANWLNLKMNFSHNFYEVVVMGPNYKELIKELNTYYLPNILIDGSDEPDSRPLTVNRYKKNEDLIYVCTNGTCQLPVNNLAECLKLINHF